MERTGGVWLRSAGLRKVNGNKRLAQFDRFEYGRIVRVFPVIADQALLLGEIAIVCRDAGLQKRSGGVIDIIVCY